MAHNLTDLLVSCIASAVFERELSEEEVSAAKEHAEELYKTAKHHDLSHLLFDVFIKYGIINKDNPLYSVLEKQKLTAIFRQLKMEAELTKIKSALSSVKILHIPLKGSVIRTLYPEPYMRTSCDIDVLVRKEDLDLAISTLTEKLSYKTDGKLNYHDVSLFSPSGVHLELHFSIQEHIDNLDRVLTRVFDYASPESEGSYTAVLAPEFQLFHIITHSYYHFVNGGSGIKPFIDFCLMKSKVCFDEEILALLCKEADVEKYRKGVEKLVSVWFEKAIHDDLTRSMQKYVLVGGVYGTTENSAVANQARAGGKLRHMLSLIFMSRRNLKVLYPILEKHPILTPICHIRRWFRIVFKGSLKKSVRILKANAKVGEDQRQSISSLFEELGL